MNTPSLWGGMKIDSEIVGNGRKDLFGMEVGGGKQEMVGLMVLHQLFLRCL